MSLRGTIFHIQRFSIHDGPGIRTTVFFKGCPLGCFWCHNPEGLRREPEILIHPTRCIACLACQAVCPAGAHGTRPDSERVYQRERCQACGRCVDECFAGALELAGRVTTVDDVVDEVLRDLPFYESSGGGVTLSGGDPTLQPAFAEAILRACQMHRIHTAVETAAHCRWSVLASLLPVTDLVMMDLKHMDSDRHRWATGVPNETILQNARRLADAGKPVLFRVPVIPTVNDAPEDISAIVEFVSSLKKAAGDGAAISLELLAFHPLAGDKYQSLGLSNRAAGLQSPGAAQMQKLADIVASYGLDLRRRVHSISHEGE